ncbi:MAG TPA: hypothetical protein VFZ61_10270, partial [Polyangiales bacterium]
MKSLRSALKSVSFLLSVLVPALLLCALVLEAYYEVPLSGSALRFARPWAGLLALGGLLVLLSRALWDHARAPRLSFSRT